MPPVAVPDVLDRMVEPFAATPLGLPGAMRAAATDAVSTYVVPLVSNHLRLGWLAVLAAGALLVVICWLRRWLQVQAAVRSSVVVPMDAPIPVRCSKHRVEPGVVGFFRPELLLPARGLRSTYRRSNCGHPDARAVAHSVGATILRAAIHMLVEAVFWFLSAGLVVGKAAGDRTGVRVRRGRHGGRHRSGGLCHRNTAGVQALPGITPDLRRGCRRRGTEAQNRTDHGPRFRFANSVHPEKRYWVGWSQWPRLRPSSSAPHLPRARKTTRACAGSKQDGGPNADVAQLADAGPVR